MSNKRVFVIDLNKLLYRFVLIGKSYWKVYMFIVQMNIDKIKLNKRKMGGNCATNNQTRKKFRMDRFFFIDKKNENEK